MGVKRNFLDSSDIDGLNVDETLLLALNGTYKLLEVVFENVDGNDESALIVDGTQIGFGLIESALGIAGATATSSGDQTNLDLSALNIIGSLVAIGDAISNGSLDNNDNFRIEAITVEAVGSVPDSGGTLVLLGLGLAAMGRWSRKRG